MGKHYEIDDILGDPPSREGVNGEHGIILEEQHTQRRAIRFLGHQTQEIKEQMASLNTMKIEWRLAKWIGGGIFLATIANIIVYVT